MLVEDEDAQLSLGAKLALEHLFQEIRFQHIAICTKRDEFLRRHIPKGHCGTEPAR